VESGGKEAQEGDFFASFLASLTQAVEETDTDKDMAAPGVLDLTFSAEQGETREEYTTSLPLEGMGLFFSKPVLDLLASLKEGFLKEGLLKEGLEKLEGKGVDVDLISERVNELLDGDETLPDTAAERLEAMLSRLRNRYETTLASDGPRHLDIEVALSENLKLGLEASLKHPRGEHPQNEETETITETTEESETLLEEAPLDGGEAMTANLLSTMVSAMTEEKEKAPDDALQPLTLPRLYAYLKPEATRSAPSKTAARANSDPADDEEKAPSSEVDGSKTDGSKRISSFVVPPYEAASRETTSPAAQDLPGSKIQAKNPKTDAFVFGEKEKDPLGETAGVKTKTTETAKFDQFFEGILSRRGSSESRFDVGDAGLDLAKEAPLSRNEALREGLDNVVRFIRTSGEQKAALIIDPPALGRVSVELVSSTTGLEASIKVGSEQVRQLVQDQLEQLRLSLAQQGVELTHFSVDVQQDNGRRQQQDTDQRRRPTSVPSGGEDDEDQTIFRVDLDRGLLYWVA
jgi:hypothetical protein